MRDCSSHGGEHKLRGEYFCLTSGKKPCQNASKLIMLPERVAVELLDPCLVQTDCRYDEAPLRERRAERLKGWVK